MKTLKLNAGVAAITQFPSILFDGEPRTYTQAEVDALRQETAANSFKAGAAKYKADANAEKDQEELKALRDEKATRQADEALGTINKELQNEDLKDTGLLSKKLFASTYSTRLTDKKGKALKKEVNAIRSELTKAKDEETLKAFFGDAVEVDAAGALKAAAKPAKKVDSMEDNFWPGTAIRKR